MVQCHWAMWDPNRWPYCSELTLPSQFLSNEPLSRPHNLHFLKKTFRYIRKRITLFLLSLVIVDVSEDYASLQTDVLELDTVGVCRAACWCLGQPRPHLSWLLPLFIEQIFWVYVVPSSTGCCDTMVTGAIRWVLRSHRASALPWYTKWSCTGNERVYCLQRIQRQ